MKKKGGLIISIGISGFAIFWLIQKVNLQEFEQAITQISYAYWLSAALIYLIGFFPRGLRWQLMLSTIKKVSLTDSTQVVALGYAANNILPFRLGELVRAYIMGNKNKISKITCLGSIGAERVIDGIVMISFLGLSMISLTTSMQQAKEVKQILFACGALFLSAVFLLIMVLVFSEAILQKGKKLLGQTGMKIIESLIHSFSFLRTKKVLFKILLLSVLVWLIEGAMFVLMAWNMGLNNPMATGYFILGIVNLGILLPSAPGYIGVYQAATVFAFLALGYSESAGLAYGLLIHLAQYIPITLIGFVIFIHLRYKVSEFYKNVSAT